MLVFFLSVTHNWSYFGIPLLITIRPLVEATQGGLKCSVFFFHNFTEKVFFPNSALCLKGLSDVSLNQKKTDVMIMHPYSLTICWLNTANRCTSSAWIILFLQILSACSVLFHCHDEISDVLLLCRSLSVVWTIYALAALLILTVIAMLAKLLLHITVK